jgi:hypothetical protein
LERRLIDVAARYFTGEEEIARTYFDSPRRSAETDRLWLRRQCYKEIWGSGVGDAKRGLFLNDVALLSDVFPRIDREIDRHAVLASIDNLRTEFSHYCLFADIHDSLGADRLDPQGLESWPADRELARLRYDCRRRLGRRGDRIVRFTEGGGGGMYLAGMKLEGRSELDDRIARACEQVYRDEIGHMRAGQRELEREEIGSGGWSEVVAAIRAILLQRLQMRNEQFGCPVPADRIHAIDAGEIRAPPDGGRRE